MGLFSPRRELQKKEAQPVFERKLLILRDNVPLISSVHGCLSKGLCGSDEDVDFGLVCTEGDYRYA